MRDMFHNVVTRMLHDSSHVYFMRDFTNKNGGIYLALPSGKQPHHYGKSPCLMGKSTISVAIFNSFLLVYQRVSGKF